MQLPCLLCLSLLFVGEAACSGTIDADSESDAQATSGDARVPVRPTDSSAGASSSPDVSTSAGDHDGAIRESEAGSTSPPGTDDSSAPADGPFSNPNIDPPATRIPGVLTVGKGGDLSFTIDRHSTTSAGVYRTDGTLIRTLWRKVPYDAGSYTQTWDGADDHGGEFHGAYEVRVLVHDVQYVWDGAIANTSAEQSGNSVHRAFLPIHDMAIAGTSAFYVVAYNEGGFGLYRFDTTAPRAVNGRFGYRDVQKAFAFVDADEDRVYVANIGGTDHTTYVAAYNQGDASQAAFDQGVKWTPDLAYPAHAFTSVIDLDTSTSSDPTPNRPTGLAVQKGGSLLAVAHGAAGGPGVVRLFDKHAGTLRQTISVSAARAVEFSPAGDLWVVSGTEVLRYGDLLGSPKVLTRMGGFERPVALAISPTQDVVLIADSGGSQQIKAFDSSGSALWTLGQAGGYEKNGADVTMDKFWFFDGDQDDTFVTFAVDGSFWVGDGGNNRNLHFAADRSYMEQLAYSPYSYVASVDRNNPTRVFNRYLEYAVDYSKPVGDSWKLVKNWGANMGPGLGGGLGSGYFGSDYGLREVTTLSNGHTYALAYHQTPAVTKNELAELTGSFLRRTGIDVLSRVDPSGGDRTATLALDGTLNVLQVNHSTFTRQKLLGFAGDDPQWAAPVALASAPESPRAPLPRYGGSGDLRTPVTSGGVVISFDPSKNDGWHLGGIRAGGSDWLWQVSPTGPLDGLGTFDIGDGINYSGNAVMAVGHDVVYGFHGEFYKGCCQASQFMHFNDDGLFIGQFGVSSDVPHEEDTALAGFAGNAYSPELVRYGGELYLWVNDENKHGPQRWHISGSDAVRELSGSGSR